MVSYSKLEIPKLERYVIRSEIQRPFRSFAHVLGFKILSFFLIY